MKKPKYKHKLHIILRFQTNHKPGKALITIKKGVVLDLTPKYYVPRKLVGHWV